ncbi:lectin-like protein [Dinothrombium tinctorium]|uniref:Lectin-like protein n=1 Tax=Dinothrombium tinctorium TaxID=1965070 RepID=A0A3S3SKY2_9ACAR|nr:lectin-like protein [Dinothrombium tinctorium]RWS16636.1 lectin-like protein [Dinothrombium tinctorium]
MNAGKWSVARCLLLPILFCCALFARSTLENESEEETNNYLTHDAPGIEKREHTLKKPYQGSGMTIPFWDFAGSTMVTQSFIRLTPDTQSKRGLLFNKVPLRSRYWEVRIHLKIDGHGKDLYGDGMAFWYVKDPLVHGNVFGHSDYFTGLGVFLDTYANQNGAHNHGHPYISAMVNNGSLHYDHDRDGTHTEVAGCESKFRGVDYDTHISIRYFNDVLTIYTDVWGSERFDECFSVKGVVLPTGYFIGVSAATGDLSDNHDVISIKTYELEGDTGPKEDRSRVGPSASIFAPPRDHVDDAPPPMSNVKFFFLVVFAIIGVVVLIAVGMVVFQKQQETSRKRFY